MDLRQAREQFARTGVVFVPRLFSAREAERCAAYVDELVAAPEVPGGVWKYHDDEARERGVRVLSRIERFRAHHAGLARVMSDARILSLLEAVLGEPVVLFKDKINLKLPGSGGFAPHQDAQAGWTRYGPTHVTLMLSIDDTTHDNGCLELSVGARRTSLAGPSWEPLDDAHVPPHSYVPQPTRAGDALLFDSYVPHRSGPNRTNAPRRVLYATYNPRAQGDAYERYFEDKRQSYPPDVERAAGRTYRYRV